MKLASDVASELLRGLDDHECYARLIGGSELELLAMPKKDLRLNVLNVRGL